MGRRAAEPLAVGRRPDHPARHRRPAPPTTRHRCGRPRRPGSGCGCRSASAPTATPVELDLKESAQGGMGPHGMLIGATGSGKSELLRTLVLGAGRHPLLRDAQLRPGRLQGRRHLPRPGRAAAHLGGHHQPRRRAAAGRPHAGRAARRADPPPGAAARRRQLHLAARLREGPGRRRRLARCPACWSSSTSSANCWPPAASSSTCS